MTPPAAATAAGRTATPPAPRLPRRVSGPARPRPLPAPRGHAAPPPMALRVAHRVRGLPDAPLLDRLIQGRAWIGIVAVALLGIVFMQVSLLKLNSAIGADVKSAQALERSNSELRAQVSRLQSGGRIQEIAGGLGLVMPPPDGFRYVTAGRPGDAERAAQSIRPPDPVEQLPPAGSALAGTQPLGAAPGQAAPTQTVPRQATTATASPPVQQPATGVAPASQVGGAPPAGQPGATSTPSASPAGQP